MNISHNYKINNRMEELKAKGTIHLIGEPRQVSEKMNIREFVLSIGDKYPQLVQFQAVNERVKFLDNAAPGMECEVKFDLRGREYQSRYYVSLNAWDIRITESNAPVYEVSDDIPF
jgi:single-strand DNA-binding protein